MRLDVANFEDICAIDWHLDASVLKNKGGSRAACHSLEAKRGPSRGTTRGRQDAMNAPSMTQLFLYVTSSHNSFHLRRQSRTMLFSLWWGCALRTERFGGSLELTAAGLADSDARFSRNRRSVDGWEAFGIPLYLIHRLSVVRAFQERCDLTRATRLAAPDYGLQDRTVLRGN